MLSPFKFMARLLGHGRTGFYHFPVTRTFASLLVCDTNVTSFLLLPIRREDVKGLGWMKFVRGCFRVALACLGLCGSRRRLHDFRLVT